MYLFETRGAFLILWTVRLLLTCKWAQGEILVYEPLRCFGCSKDGSFLCEGEDFQQGSSINCPENNKGGSIKRNDFLNLNQDPTIFDVPNYDPQKGYDMKHQETNKNNILTLRNYNGKFMRVMLGFRCWIMKVEYRANGRIEIYKGCERDIGIDFGRYSAFEGYPSVRDLRVGCKELNPVYLGPSRPADVTVCFCDTPYCNNATITHTNREVGLEDVEQRMRLKNKSSADTIHQLAQTCINSSLILVLALTILFAPNII